MKGTSPGFSSMIPLMILLLLPAVMPCPVFSGDIETMLEKAESGDPDSQVDLGNAYYFGKDIRQDHTEATKWWRKAAEQGVANARFNLGVAYDNGRGVPQDYSLAYFWYSLPVSRSTGKLHEDAAKLRDRVAKKLTPEQLSKAKQMTREWEAKHPRK